MADGKPGAGPKRETPYPPNWNSMTAGKKREWMAKNRPTTPASVQPARPAQPPTQPQPPAPESDEGQEGTALEDGPDYGQEQSEEQSPEEVRVSITMPGQDVREMSGRDFVRLLLGALTDALGGASENL